MSAWSLYLYSRLAYLYPQVEVPYYIGQLVTMMKEQKDIKGRNKYNQIYDITNEFDSDTLQIHQINDSIYYFHYCSAKQADKDYRQGYFTIVYHTIKKNLGVFFRVSKKLGNLLEEGKDLFENPGFPCKKVSHKSKVGLLVYYESKGLKVSLDVLTSSYDIAKYLNRLIMSYQGDLNEPKIKSKKQIESDTRQPSTGGSKNSQDDFTFHKGKNYHYSGKVLTIGSTQSEVKKQSQLKMLNTRIEQLQRQLNAEKNRRKDLMKIIEENQRSSKSKSCDSDTTQELTIKIEKLQENVKIMKEEANELREENKRLENAMKRMSFENAEYEARIKSLDLAIQEYKQSGQKGKYYLQDDLKKLNYMLQAQRKKVQDLAKQNQALVISNNAFKKHIEELLVKNTDLTAHKTQFQKTIREQAKRLKILAYELQTNQQKQKNNRQAEIETMNKRMEQYQKELSQAKQQIAYKDKLIKQANYVNIFNGQLLQNYSTHKTFLINQIELYMNRSIIKTKNIYKYDPLNKVNFHNYFDNHSNFVIVIRLSNGCFLAGFSQSAFYPKLNANDTGLIISLTNQRVFRCIADKKSITYDDYYIIFGNSQLRIKSMDDKVFSNFGISNGFYNSNGCKVDMLLGDGNNREVTLDGYEIYQIIFQ